MGRLRLVGAGMKRTVVWAVTLLTVVLLACDFGSDALGFTGKVSRGWDVAASLALAMAGLVYILAWASVVD